MLKVNAIHPWYHDSTASVPERLGSDMPNGRWLRAGSTIRCVRTTRATRIRVGRPVSAQNELPGYGLSTIPGCAEDNHHP
eukprot:3928366-Rhodomonas_salina.2